MLPPRSTWRWLLLISCCAAGPAAARHDGTLTINVTEQQSGAPLAVRLELSNARGRPVRVRPEGAVVTGAGVYFEGSTTLKLRRGQYTFVLEAGPEYRTRPGRFTIDRRSEGVQDVTLLRRVNMAAEGWRAGDLDVQLPLANVQLAMRSRGVDFAPVTVVVNRHGKCRRTRLASTPPTSERTPPLFGPWATLDLRRGGGLLLVGGEGPVDVCEFPADGSSLATVDAARDEGAKAIALAPWAWDLPLWAATGKLDAVQIINRTSLADGVAPIDGGLPRDKRRYPDPHGAGRWGEAIYHHLLNCGLRIPPAAGSGAGTRANPIGANRTYVHTGDEFTRDAWLDGLSAGRVFVTNGPLLRTHVEGRPPGQVFHLEPGESREFQIGLDLAFYEQTQVEYLEIVKNGKVEHEIRLDELAAKAGRLPPVEFSESGWFLVRAVTNNARVYQFASTGPYYVESNYQRRVSRASARFFLDWLDAAAKEFAGNDGVLADVEAARPFWRKLQRNANAE